MGRRILCVVFLFVLAFSTAAQAADQQKSTINKTSLAAAIDSDLSIVTVVSFTTIHRT